MLRGDVFQSNSYLGRGRPVSMREVQIYTKKLKTGFKEKKGEKGAESSVELLRHTPTNTSTVLLNHRLGRF